VDTKLTGDIAEQAAVLYALKQGWGVLKPVGDRLPFSLCNVHGNVSEWCEDVEKAATSDACQKH
jgi:formylglycine-generating enzyme required for sulfatase activity